MYITFKKLSSKARIWIYQANRALTDEEVVKIENAGLKFIDGWQAHGQPLKASIKIFHQQFIVLAADESFNKLTGCAIDSSVDFIKSMVEEFQVDFLDKTHIAFLRNNEVYLTPLKNIASNSKEGKITKQTFIFNNLVSNKEDFEKQWLTPAKNTWLSRYF